MPVDRIPGPTKPPSRPTKPPGGNPEPPPPPKQGGITVIPPGGLPPDPIPPISWDGKYSAEYLRLCRSGNNILVLHSSGVARLFSIAEWGLVLRDAFGNVNPALVASGGLVDFGALCINPLLSVAAAQSDTPPWQGVAGKTAGKSALAEPSIADVLRLLEPLGSKLDLIAEKILPNNTQPPPPMPKDVWAAAVEAGPPVEPRGLTTFDNVLVAQYALHGYSLINGEHLTRDPRIKAVFEALYTGVCSDPEIIALCDAWLADATFYGVETDVQYLALFQGEAGLELLQQPFNRRLSPKMVALKTRRIIDPENGQPKDVPVTFESYFYTLLGKTDLTPGEVPVS